MDTTRLRFAAALMHSVPDARLSITHDNGVTAVISYEDDSQPVTTSRHLRGTPLPCPGKHHRNGNHGRH